MDGLIIAEQDDEPRRLLTIIEQAEARGIIELLRPTIADVKPTVRDALLVTVTRAHQRLAPDLLARILGVRRKVLSDRLVQAGFPTAQRLIAWGRLVVAAKMLEDNERTADSVALALDFPSGSAFRNTCQRYVHAAPHQTARAAVRPTSSVRCCGTCSPPTAGARRFPASTRARRGSPYDRHRSRARSRREEAEQGGDLTAATMVYRRLSAMGDPLGNAQALFRLGRIAWRQRRLDDALELYERARAAALDLADDDLRAAIENGVGSVYCQRGIFTQARASFAVASELACTPALRGRIQINTGALAMLQGGAAEARASYERAVEILVPIADEEGLTLAYHNLALAHVEEGEWEAAERSFELCLALAERRGDRAVMASAMLNQAELRCEAERYPDALERTGRALLLFGELADESGRAAALRVEGEIYRKLHQLEEAEPRLKEAIRIAGRLQLSRSRRRPRASSGW